MIRALAAAAVFAISIISAAHAAGTAPQGITVAYGDLDHSAVAGQSELMLRLQNAAARLCSPVLGTDTPGSDQSVLEHSEIYHACIGRLSDRTMAGIKTSRN